MALLAAVPWVGPSPLVFNQLCMAAFDKRTEMRASSLRLLGFAPNQADFETLALKAAIQVLIDSQVQGKLQQLRTITNQQAMLSTLGSLLNDTYLNYLTVGLSGPLGLSEVGAAVAGVLLKDFLFNGKWAEGYETPISMSTATKERLLVSIVTDIILGRVGERGERVKLLSKNDYDEQSAVWQVTHGKIISYRTEKNLTIKAFLDVCKLPQESYYQQLCAKNGKDMHPPNHQPNAADDLFLGAVTKLLDSDLPLMHEPVSVDHIVTDLNYDHTQDLRKLGIFWLFVDAVKGISTLVVTCSLSADESDIRHFLLRHSLDLNVDFRRLLLLAPPPPPHVSITSALSHGTITPVQLKSPCVVALTCCHCVGPLLSILHVQDGENLREYGVVILTNSALDFAFIRPPRTHLPAPFNRVDGQSLWFSSFWRVDGHIIPEKIEELMNKTVCKVGITTGWTTGVIVGIDRGSGRMSVRCSSPGSWFAHPGDSGSLVFLQDSGLVVGLVQGLFPVTVADVCVLPVWHFYDILEKAHYSILHDEIYF